MNPIINENGNAHPMTDAQMREWAQMREEAGELPLAQKTEAEQIAELKRQNEEMRRMIETAYMEGVNEA